MLKGGKKVPGYYIYSASECWNFNPSSGLLSLVLSWTNLLHLLILERSWEVSSTTCLAYFLAHLHFNLMSSLFAIFATRNDTGLNVIISVISLLYLKRGRGKPMILFLVRTNNIQCILWPCSCK